MRPPRDTLPDWLVVSGLCLSIALMVGSIGPLAQQMEFQDAMAGLDSARVKSAQVQAIHFITVPMTASHYGEGDGYEGRTMANGQPMDPKALTTAHRTFSLGTRLEVIRGNRSVEVEVTDRTSRRMTRLGRDLDLSAAAFARLEDPRAGVIRVRVRVLP